MSEVEEKLKTNERINELCGELKDIFQGVGLVTILVRNPDNSNKGLLMTEDEVEEIIPAVKRFAYRN